MDELAVDTSTGPLTGCRIALTGKLASMTHRRAREVVRENGGVATVEVSRLTSMLVVGMNGWPILPDGTISRRLARAETLNAGEAEIQIVSETVFLERIGRLEPESAARKSHPADVIRRMVGISDESLRRWEQLGLIRSTDGRYDYQDLVSLRTIAELIDQGVRPEAINKTLRRLSAVLPDMQRPLSQLNFVVQSTDALLAEFDDIRMAADGQIVFDFAGRATIDEPILKMESIDSPVDELLAYGQACEELERYDEAAEAYRELIAQTPRCPEAFFNLGNALRAMDRFEAAEEQYRIAVAQDESLAQAWFNLADLLEEQGRADDAVRSLEAALRADPLYADAHFNLAMCFEKLDRLGDAAKHWRRYLDLDGESEWAEVAGRHLTMIDERSGPAEPAD